MCQTCEAVATTQQTIMALPNDKMVQGLGIYENHMMGLLQDHPEYDKRKPETLTIPLQCLLGGSVILGTPHNPDPFVEKTAEQILQEISSLMLEV
jgi:hypothetical protein